MLLDYRIGKRALLETKLTGERGVVVFSNSGNTTAEAPIMQEILHAKISTGVQFSVNEKHPATAKTILSDPSCPHCYIPNSNVSRGTRLLGELSNL